MPRKHVPGQRQGPGRLMSLRNNSLIKWIGIRVTSSAHFMNSPGFANASQSDAVGTARALSVHPSHISKWRAMLKHMGQTKPPELHLLTQDPDSNMRSRASLAIFHNDSAISHSTSSAKKKRAGFWLSAILSMQDIVKSNKQTWWEKYRKPVSHQTLLKLIPVPSPSCLLHSHCQVSYLRNWVLKRLPVYHLIC